MALCWDYRKPAGTITQEQNGHEFTFMLYEGNALMIVMYEYTDDEGTERAQLMWFFNSEEHAKICLGLQADYISGEKRNIFAAEPVKQLTIYREHCRGWKTIADLFAQAFPEITITILAKAPAQEGGESK